MEEFHFITVSLGLGLFCVGNPVKRNNGAKNPQKTPLTKIFI